MSKTSRGPVRRESDGEKIKKHILDYSELEVEDSFIIDNKDEKMA